MGPAEMALTRMFFWAELEGQVAHRRFERGLGQRHHVVVRHDFFGGVVGEGDNAAAFGHQRHRAAAHGDQRVDAHVVRDAKALAAGVDELALQVLGGRIGDGVHQDVDLAVLLLERGEQGLDLLVVGDVALEAAGAGEIVDQVLGFGFMRSFW
jgi:hypothetical protein